MSKPYYEFFCPVKIIAGHAALENIPFELNALGSKKPMIITDKGIKNNGLLSPIEDIFLAAEQQIGYIFDDVPADSSLETVQTAAKAYRDYECDAILAIGGGSVIDTAKATNILVSEGGDDLLKYSGAHNLPKPLKPFFVIPTTSGTGSEATMVAVVADQKNNVKLAFASNYLMPNAAILDSRMTLTLPNHITAMTGMDALTHAIEAYTCMAANPLSDAYATAAIKKISENLFVVLANPKNEQARLELSQASTMAGIAFSNSMVGLVHSLGHALGAVAHLPHGICMNLFLPYVLEYNFSVNANKVADLLLPLAGAEIYANTPEEHRAEHVITMILAMRDRLFEQVQLPRTLRETHKVSLEQLDKIAEKALDDGSIIYNPKEVTLTDLKNILQKAW
ncbi:iron-containing alcohol dehydrogenase [Acinetobacter pollinis]|uniref:iron-containing alcohol dehydrogenase n=1 Tax=Acinetobacter pollinis TaxID=2605270 RepID=UPI0018A2B307|nr:iron-containing alcohol dehydrogenase [Acinetobacter pollinis]MBF7690793.1 iron-containing alcohol dehydrogenase [Acinetobacter pollinis]MBF7692606.1 iron-containing alcohol dehydrogenase [Acinetobacter pollinis]MBF7698415.1 iron-containing alcohol dehydrogenase [Acinetobacter pollinis]MBF7699578.1 iron-containing alcohol dehydrogenase [Acinetobacter pollinis]